MATKPSTPVESLTISHVENIIGIPSKAWVGNCYGISCAIVDAGLAAGEAAYGHWRGPISPGSPFASRTAQEFVRHGWIELSDGRVLDPTRWVFEATAPYLYLGEETNQLWPYDRGGQIVRESMQTPPPALLPTDRLVRLAFAESAASKRVAQFGVGPVEDGFLVLSTRQALWLANLSVRRLGVCGPAILNALVAAHLSGFIPIDTREMILGPSSKA